MTTTSRGAVLSEQPGDRRVPAGLHRCEQFERTPPVGGRRVDVLNVLALRVHDQYCTPPPSDVRIEQGAGGSNLHVEALAHHRLGVCVEQHGDLVARSVLELLHHQLAAPRRRRPVHPAQRLALLVLAHAVQLEPRIAPQQQAATVVGAVARLRKERTEPDKLWIHEQRSRLRQRHDRLLEGERIR